MIKITKHEYSKPLQTRQHQARMSSNQDLKSWMKETSTLREIVSIYFIKSNKNVVGSKKVIGLVIVAVLGFRRDIDEEERTRGVWTISIVEA
uniref:Uncharacterized protein n=1 Tax=Tanacetum cinerariifolium TaxID=118510 RepID=A0A699GJV8_TANCI|nr:hypothetical protein [Tanacetum cinerariifolium]